MLPHENEKGFMLIELMIIVAFIGILTAVAIPAYVHYIDESRMAAALTSETPIPEKYRNRIKYYYGQNKEYLEKKFKDNGTPIETWIFGEDYIPPEASFAHPDLPQILTETHLANISGKIVDLDARIPLKQWWIAILFDETGQVGIFNVYPEIFYKLDRGTSLPVYLQ